MENIIIVPSVAGMEWFDDIYPGRSVAELPVAGRRGIDYALECARRFDVACVEVLDWRFSSRLASDFSGPTNIGRPVHYIGREGPLPRSLDDLFGQGTPLTQDIKDGLVVVWGPCLSGHSPGEVALEPLKDSELANTPPGVYRREGGRWMRVMPRGLVIRNTKSWLRMNIAVLNSPDVFTLPGYSADKDVHIGRNVVMEYGTKVTGPALLNDDCWCARNVEIDRDVIMGSGSFVGEGTHLSRTVVCDDTYVGAGLDLTDKIVVGHRIIDAVSGAWTDVEEQGLVRSIDDFHWNPFRKLWRFLQGASRGRRS